MSRPKLSPLNNEHKERVGRIMYVAERMRSVLAVAAVVVFAAWCVDPELAMVLSWPFPAPGVALALACMSALTYAVRVPSEWQ